MKASLRRAVFFDRDGVLNRAIVRERKPYPPRTLQEFEIVPEASEALQRLRQLDFVMIVVSNQPDVARGTLDRNQIDQMNVQLMERLPLDEVMICPHDDRDGCECRKPKPGLFLQAACKYGLDLGKSFMVGDRWRDIDAGHAAGCTTVFLDSHYQERGPSKAPNSSVPSLKEAVDWIIRNSQEAFG